VRYFANEGKKQQNHPGQPGTWAKDRLHIKPDGYTCSNQQSCQNSKFRHSIQEYERQIVRAKRDHKGGVEPVQVMSCGSSHQREIKRKRKRNLHPQSIHGVPLGQGCGSPHQSQQQLRHRKNEKAAYEQRDDRCLGDCQVANAADISQTRLDTSWPAKPPKKTLRTSRWASLIFTEVPPRNQISHRMFICIS
jgi:hypothetical protein